MTKFEKKCREVSEKLDISVMLFQNKAPFKPYEDDGNLHIYKRGEHASFDVGGGQNLPGDKQNERTRSIMKELGLAVTDSCLVEDNDEEEDCPHCGRLMEEW
jgi:hypothetical protein